MSIAARIGSSLIVPPSCEDPMRLRPSVEQVPDQARRSFVDATGLGRAREAVRPDKTSRGSRAGDDRAMDEEADKQVRYVEAPTQAVGSERTVFARVTSTSADHAERREDALTSSSRC
jgi:hypothetical protein